MTESRVLVRDLMSKDIVAVEPDATIAEAVAKMEQHRVHELPVMQNSALKGWINYDSLIQRPHIAPATKVSHLMTQPFKMPAATDLESAADLMIRQNMRAAPVSDTKGNVIGVISRTDIMKAAAAVPDIAEQTLEKVMTRDLETINDEDSIDEAAHMLRDSSLRQLLVLDKKGKLVGTVGREVVLHALSGEDRTSTRGRGKSPMGADPRTKGRKVDMKGLVEPPIVLAPGARVGDAIKHMTKQRRSMVVIEEEGFPVGVVSRANILERLAARRAPVGPLVQVIGLADHVDSSTLDLIHNYARRTLAKVAQEFTVEFLSLHYKVYKAKTEGDSKFSITAHLSTEEKFIVTKADDWDPIRATDAVLDELERRTRESKELRLDRRKGSPRRKTEFYTAAP